MGSNKKVYGLKDICRKIMTIEEAEIKQNKFAEKLDELRAYPVKRSKYIYLKETVSKIVKTFYDGW